MLFAEGVGHDKQAFKYNGKELEDMHGLNLYDYLARQYDFGYARFTTIDPLAEKYYSISPYVYCMNNPVRYIDPTGMSPEDDQSKDKKQKNWFSKVKDLFAINLEGGSSEAVTQSLSQQREKNNVLQQIGDGLYGLADALTSMNPFGSFIKTAAKASVGGEISGEDIAFAAMEAIPTTGIGKIGVKTAKVTTKVAKATKEGVTDFKKISGKFLKESGVDAHQLKRDFLGDKAKISHYDLYKETRTGEILILEKGGKGTPIQTGQFIE